MHRQKQACTDKFLTTVTEGVVHGIYKGGSLSSFGVPRQHKVSGGKWTFHHCVTSLHTNLKQLLKDRVAFHPMLKTANFTAWSVNARPNLGRYEASLEAVLPPRKTCNRGMYRL